MPTIEEEGDMSNDAALGEFFDFGNATAPEIYVDDQVSAWASEYSNPHLPGENHLPLEASQIEQTQDQIENQSPDYSNFADWIPRYAQPDEPCDYCRSRQLQCFQSWGKLTCTACDTLFRHCSFVHVEAGQQDSDRRDSTHLGLIDTLHSVAEDTCQEQGTFTGVRPLRSKGVVAVIARSDDGSKKASPRFSRAALKVLKQWFEAHSDNPYPTEDEKTELCTVTELKYTQINTWLANARRRNKAKAACAGNISPRLRASTPAIGISASSSINVTSWENMNPLDRWKHSPPQNEPAPLNAIADAIDSGYLPNYSDTNTPSTLGYRGLGSGLESSRNSSRSDRRALSMTSLDNSASLSMSAESSAAWSGSHESLGSFSSFGSGLNGKKDRRRRRRAPQASLKHQKDDAKKRIYQCTFCTDTFKSKYDWTRHEKSLHISLEKYICCPLGPTIIDPNNGMKICAYCLAPEPTSDHFETHGHQQCNEKSKDSRTFYRKDHLRQHMRLVHDSELLPHMDAWRIEAKFVNSRCGLCSQRFTMWQERVDHLAAHFKEGLKMDGWKGCRGLDPDVAATVSSAMPPYLIGMETVSPNPFSATNRNTCATMIKHIEAGGSTKATCWEILTVRMGRFCKEQSDKGIVLSDEALQRQARIICFDTDDPWEQTAADNPEWLDLFKKAHGLDFIPSTIGGEAKYVPEDLEWYGDLGMRIPFSVQQRQGRLNPKDLPAGGLKQDDATGLSALIESSDARPKEHQRYSSLSLPLERAVQFETVRGPWPASSVLGELMDMSSWNTTPISDPTTVARDESSQLAANGYNTGGDMLCGLGFDPISAAAYEFGAGDTACSVAVASNIAAMIEPMNAHFTSDSFPNPVTDSVRLPVAAASTEGMMLDMNIEDINFEDINFGEMDYY